MRKDLITHGCYEAGSNDVRELQTWCYRLLKDYARLLVMSEKVEAKCIS